MKAPKDSRRSETHAIETLEEQWRTAVVDGDSVLMNKLLSDDFLGISARGTLSDKQQYLQHIATHATQFSSFNVMDMKVRVQPASAVAVSQAHITGQLEGAPVEGTFRYTKVYARDGAGWKITNFEATRTSTPLAGERDMSSGVPLNGGRLPSGTRQP